MKNQQFLYTKKWVQDKEAKNCKICQTPFKAIFKRKHHCRNCGEVFCDSCSNFFMDKTNFKNFQDIKKNKVRLCQDCYQEISKKLKENGDLVEDKNGVNFNEEQQMRKHSKSLNVFNEKLPNTEKETYSPGTLNLVPTAINDQKIQLKVNKIQIPEIITIGEDIERKQKKLEQDMIEIIEDFVEKRIRAFGINDKWQGVMCKFITNSVQDLKYHQTDNQQKIDNKVGYIRIKIIPFINYTATRYLRGITIRKNIAHKRMKTHHKKPLFLLLSGSLDLDIQNFENVVKNQNKYLQQALEQIEMLKPNIILVEKSINNILLNELVKKDITVSIQCKITQLRKVEQAVQGRIQRAVDVFTMRCDKDCIGKSETASYVCCDPETIKSNLILYNQLDDKDKSLLEVHLEKKKNRGYTLLFIHTPQSNNSFQITLSGPKISELINVKYCFQQLFCICYQMSLEFEMILLDQKIKQDLELTYKSNDNEISPLITCGEIFNFSVLIMTEYENQIIKLCKVRYYPAVVNKIHDIQKKNNEESLENYIQENIKNINNKKIPYFCQLCDCQKEIVSFYGNFEQNKEDIGQEKYTKDDVSLGKYISNKASIQGSKKKCGKCQTKKINHVSIRYGPGAFVRCVVDKKKQQNLQVKASTNLSKEFMNASSFLYPTLNDEILTQTDNLQGETESRIQQQIDLNILTYIKCLNSNCDKQLTKPFKLEKYHLEFSFHRLIQYLIKNSLRLKKIHRKDWLLFEGEIKEQGDKLDGCNHSQTERVFECDEYQIKFFTNLFDIYQIKHFQYDCQDVKQHIEKCDKEELDKRKDILICYLQKLLQLIQNYDKNVRYGNMAVSITSIQIQLNISEKNNNIVQETSSNLISNFIEKLNQASYPDFIVLEQDSMQVYQRLYQIEIAEQMRIQKIRNDLDYSRSKISMFSLVTSEGGPFMKNSIRKAQKEFSTLIQTQSNNNENLYPTQNQSTIQLTQSPQSSPNQGNLNQYEEQQQELGNEKTFENDQNFFNYLIEKWPRLAMNYDQTNMQIKSFYDYIPIYSQNDIGLITAALNHPKYYDLYENKYKFVEFSDKIENTLFQKEIELEAERILKEQSKLAVTEEFQIKLSKINSSYKKMSSNNLQEVEEDEQTISQTLGESPRKPSKCATVQLYYPKQFECIRILNRIKIKQFIKSITSCANWNSAGGKSGSTFFKSSDNLFIFKAVKESEFNMFESFAPKYFEYLYSNIFAQKPSVLNKIYGMFTIKNSLGTTYYIAMENLFWGLEGELIVYDLKGSKAKRWNRKNLKTLLDTNYIIDRNGEPLPIQEQDYYFLEKALESDSQFLLDVAVVDYSLLLIIDKQNQQIKLSIIDYLQCYDLKKKMETTLKTAINLGTEPTIINPKEYQERFMKAMKEYFMGIYSSL
ncbi:unnamed protein product [Paramecium sonneborni]|uniref:1-phosphatidylinositol-3-phosphate 5-kinase n=1 Tax=Paramecium sonneborni TaxID=65129 RepID=A0A8S1LU02_9CILI|nr:unnamed protein product [Paramecium sonneborni]